MPRREGSCNQCGECCGSVDAPEPRNPYPRAWPESIARWSLDDANEVCPMLTMFGIANQGDEIGYSTPNHSYSPTGSGTTYYGVWITGVGLCKDTSVAHDGSSYNTECPFLEADKSCGLIGTGDDGARSKYCRPEERLEYEPANDIWTYRHISEWQASHPNCSYTFVEVSSPSASESASESPSEEIP